MQKLIKIQNRLVGPRSSTNSNRYEHVVALLETQTDKSPFLCVTDPHHWQHSMATHTHTHRSQFTTLTRHSTHNCSYRIAINISHFNAIDTTLCSLKAFDAYRCAYAPSPSERRRNGIHRSFAYLPPTVSRCLVYGAAPAGHTKRRCARAAPFSHSLFFFET